MAGMVGSCARFRGDAAGWGGGERTSSGDPGIWEWEWLGKHEMTHDFTTNPQEETPSPFMYDPFGHSHDGR